MSHFTVIVCGNDVDKALYPYWELDLAPDELKADPRSEFNDCTEEVEHNFNNGSVDRVVMPDGSYKHTWDEEFRVAGSIGMGSNTHKVPDHLEVKKILHKEKYADVDTFAKEWYGYTRNKDGKFGYYCNPKQKWDWKSIGGRWNGYFRHKHRPKFPKDIKKGSPSWTNKDNLPDKNACDVIRKCDIDVMAMKKAKREDAEKWWKEGMKPENEKSREFMYGIKKGMKQMDYIKQHTDNFLAPHAVIMPDGSWIEKSKMGWWGITTDENDNWGNDFQDIFDKLPDDTLLTMVDCHI